MEIKSTLIFTSLILVSLFLAYWGWGQKSKASDLLNYATMLESVNDSLLTSTFTLDNEIVELKSINSQRLSTIDELGNKLQNLQLQLNTVLNTTVEVDTIYVQGVADTVIVSPEETIYTVNEFNPNYTLSGTLKAPSGEYSFKVTQMPFGLEVREVTTPTGRKRVYARIIGRTDLNITDIDFKAADDKNSEKKWAVGPGVIISNGPDWGISIRRDRLSMIGTKNSVAASWDLLRF